VQHPDLSPGEVALAAEEVHQLAEVAGARWIAIALM